MNSRGKFLVSLAQAEKDRNNDLAEQNLDDEFATALNNPILFLEEPTNTNVLSSTNHGNVITLAVLDNNDNENIHIRESNINHQRDNYERESETIGIEGNIENAEDFHDPDYVVDSSPGCNSSSESEQENNSNAVYEHMNENHGTENPSNDNGTRKRRNNSERYKKIKRKTLRNLGEEYESGNGKVIPARKVSEVDCTKCKLNCNSNFSLEERQTIHKNYWSLASYTRQRDFICQAVDSVPVKRRRPITANKKERNVTYKYYFNNINNGSKMQVCKIFFLRTLDIGERTVFVAKKKQIDELSPFVGNDERGRHPPHHKLSEINRQRIKDHIESFPRLESHYCRKRTKRQYLSSDLNISKMFDLFKNKCIEENIQCNINFGTYSKIFITEYNLSFHHPKKDACRVCENHKYLTEDEQRENQEILEEHLKNKNLAREEKEKDKMNAKENSTHKAFTFDLQAVLYSPCSNVSSFYYTHKFCTYNLTVNDQAEKKGICFVWNETDGKRGSDEIGTAIFKLLHSLPKTIKNVTLTSDSCGGQNRNRFVAALLLFVANTTHFEEINLKFLETGHTQMEVDSIHSLIERAKKGNTVYSPLEWPVIIRSASRKYPLKVEHLEYSDFIDLKDLKAKLIPTGNLNKDTEGSVVQWMKIKWLQFKKDHVYFKTSYEQTEFKEINFKSSRRSINLSTSCSGIVLKKKFSEPLQIDEKKLNSLRALCNRGDIPTVYHNFYKSLKANRNSSGECVNGCVLKSDEEEDPVLDM